MFAGTPSGTVVDSCQRTKFNFTPARASKIECEESPLTYRELTPSSRPPV